jgi:hypothetical protein
MLESTLCQLRDCAILKTKLFGAKSMMVAKILEKTHKIVFSELQEAPFINGFRHTAVGAGSFDWHVQNAKRLYRRLCIDTILLSKCTSLYF